MLRLVCCCCATCKYTGWAGALGNMRGRRILVRATCIWQFQKCKDEFKKNLSDVWYDMTKNLIGKPFTMVGLRARAGNNAMLLHCFGLRSIVPHLRTVEA